MGDLIFVDTSAWVAAFVNRDQHHDEAVRAMREYLQESRPLVTTEYIFDETVTRVRYQGGHEEAVDVGEHLLTSRALRRVEIGLELREEAWRIFKKCKDQKFSFTDCTSFATMRKFGIVDAFTFDDDFRKMGYVTLP